MKAIISYRALLYWGAAFAIGAVPTAAQTYNPATDFSASANPGAAWSYGWSQTLGGAFHLDMFFTTSDFNFTDIDMWQGRQSGDYPPCVAFNATANPQTIVGTVTMLPGDLLLHPGAGGEYCVLRWTAPVEGSFSVSAAFRGLDIHPTTTDVHVLRDGVSLFDGTVSALGAGPTFVDILNISTGDTIDFVVGYGFNHDYHFDSTGLSASLVSVPETASTLLLAALGFGSVVAWHNSGRIRIPPLF